MEDTGDIEHSQHSPDTVPKEVDQTEETMEPAEKKVELSENVNDDNKRDETSTQGHMSVKNKNIMPNSDLTTTTGDEEKSIGALNTFEKNAQQKLQDEKTDQSSGSDNKNDKTESGCEARDNAVKEKLSEKLDTTISSTEEKVSDKPDTTISSKEEKLSEKLKTTISSTEEELSEKLETTIYSREEETNETIDLQDAIAKTDIIDRLPDFVSPEETNFLRFCHLIQKVAPQAVRHRFDQVFPPADLEGVIQRNKTLLEDLRVRRIITHPQWKLIFPSGTMPLSSTFDITTMMVFFRHLANIAPISRSYDTLPPPSDTSLGGDLERIKYFRNNIAHYLEKNRKLDNTEYPIVWETASMAVSRIGGKLYDQECSNLRTANLDSSYMDIYREFLMKQTDPVPQNERENIDYLMEKWNSTKKLFYETKAAKHLMKVIQKENVAIVTGSPGTGKSFTVQNVLLSMKEEGYDVIPVRSSTDLVQYFSRSARQIFYLDNLCGKHNISNSDIEEWDRNRERLIEMFTNPTTKCILICRLQIVQDPKFENLKLKTYQVINLSGAHQLTLKEKQSVGQMHISKSIIEHLTDEIIVNCLCFPLLSSLYDKHSHHTDLYFAQPKTYFDNELTELRNRPDKTKYGCIVLCVIFNNYINFNYFSRKDEKESQMVSEVFEELEVNAPPKKAIQSGFDSMVGSFFRKTHTEYKSIHDYMFDIYCVHVSKSMINLILLYGDSELISDRALLESLGESVENAIIIPSEFEKQYFERILKDLSLGRSRYVFGSSQMKYKSYHTKFISLISTHDFNVNVSDDYCRTPLYISSEAGYVDIVEMLCNKGADVNQCDEIGWTPLTVASDRGHINIVELLCNKGADVNQRDGDGATPLTIASYGGHIDVVEQLCSKGADVNQCSRYGSTPLTAASWRGHIDVVELLCKKGADVNQCDKNGWTPLTPLTGWTPLTASSRKGYIKVVELLCSKGADVNQCDEEGSTPMTAASEEGHIDVVELLCNKEADVNQCGGDGSTPLTAASWKGHIDVVELLCKKGADVNQCDENGWTPLTAASRKGYIKVVELLCNKGADVNQYSRHGSTPLTAASGGGDIDVVELLCNKGADVNKSDGNGWTPLTVASRECHIDVIELLCDKGAEVNQCDGDGSTPLTAASEEGHIEVVELLCNKGADVNQCDEDESTPLTAASYIGHIDVVELLCSKGGDVNQCGIFGSTPLTAASVVGHIDVVELLCDKGADVNQCSIFGSTPLTRASEGGHINVVELLCNKGADVNQRSSYGSTPLTVASKYGYLNVVDYLRKKGGK